MELNFWGKAPFYIFIESQSNNYWKLAVEKYSQRLTSYLRLVFLVNVGQKAPPKLNKSIYT